jgi:hypothetical protein
MKPYRNLKNQDLTKTDTKTLEQARDELTQDIAHDNIHSIEKHDMFGLAAQIVQELEKRKGGREAYQKERQRSMPQSEGNPIGTASTGVNAQIPKKKTISFSTVLLIITIIILILVIIFFV